MAGQPSDVLVVGVRIRFDCKIFPLSHESNHLVLLAVSRLSAEKLPQNSWQTIIAVGKQLGADAIVDDKGAGVVDLVDPVTVIPERGIASKPFKDVPHLIDESVVKPGIFDFLEHTRI